MSERFSRYLSVLLVGPLLVFSAMGITATVMNTRWAQRLLAVDLLELVVLWLGNLMPYVLVIGAFTFIYVFIPNTRVRPGPAFVGGLVGGVLWQSAGWAFAVFVASSTQYAAIYSGFAILVLFMIWLYLSWLILLFGASVAFYAQNPQYLLPLGGEPRLSNRMRERLALAVSGLVAAAYREGRPPLTLHDLTQRLGVPVHGVAVVVKALQKGRLLVESAEEPRGFLPARDLATVSLHDVLALVRSDGEDRYLNPAAFPVPASVEEALDRMEAESANILGQVSVASLAEARPA
jgi:membrane protein